MLQRIFHLPHFQYQHKSPQSIVLNAILVLFLFIIGFSTTTLDAEVITITESHCVIVQ